MKLPTLFYDSHLNCDVLSASSHHIKAGVTSFTALTKCKLFTNGHRDTAGNLRENKSVPKPQTYCCSGALVRGRTSSHFCSQLTVSGDSLQPRTWTPQYSAAKLFHQVLAIISQSRNCWGLKEEPASVRKNIQSRC